MTSNDKTDYQNVKIETIRKGTPKYKIKSYVIFIILLALFVLVFMVLGQLGNDFMGLMIFLILMIVPVLVIFRNQLPNILPDFISDSLLEIDHKQNKGSSIEAYDIDIKQIQQAKIAGVCILVLASIVLIADYRKKIGDKMSIYKIMASLLCLIIAAIMLSNVTGKDISLSFKEDREESKQ